jgi:hypothetical protein
MEVIKNPIVEMSSPHAFYSALRNIQNIRHEKELLQISHGELKIELDKFISEGKTPESILYKRTILNLRMLELKIAMADNDIEHIKSYPSYKSYLPNKSIDCIWQPIPGSIHVPAKSESETS